MFFKIINVYTADMFINNSMILNNYNNYYLAI